MFIPRMNAVSQDTAVFITSCFHCIGENMFMLAFTEPAAFRITGTAFLRFNPFCNFFFLCIIIAPAAGWGIISVFFLRSFPT